nr:alpha/beta hydrolase [Jannaschia sp. S6380]
MRRGFRNLALGAAGPGDGSLRFRPEGTACDLPPVVWFHGGGYVFGAPATHSRIGRYLADTHGLAVHLPRYRLAPEHPWPAQLDDALSAIPDGPTPILAGDSAGGHLALVTALRMARDGRAPRALLLFSPNTDRTEQSGTRRSMEDGDPMVDDAADRRLARMCFGDRDPADVQVSPLLDDLSRLPPTWIEVGTPEVLLDDARLLHARGQAAGADIGIAVTPGLLHMAQIWAPWWDEACRSLDRAAAFALARF